MATVHLHIGQVLCSDSTHGNPRPFNAEYKLGTVLRMSPHGAVLTDDRLVMTKLLARHSEHPSRANCTIDAHTIKMTHGVPPRSPLILGMCESSVLTQDIPVVFAACNEHVCDQFLVDKVPYDTNTVAGRPSGIDGYITVASMARLVCYAPRCTTAAIIGCGYGEMVALFALSGRTICMGFEMFESRRDIARTVTAAVGVFDRTPLFGALSTYTEPWPDTPTLLWCNNYRFNDDPSSNVPNDLLGIPHFPADTSILVCMVPFSGEIEIPVCMCGNCYDGFCDHRGLPGCHIIRPSECVQVSEFCGPHMGFADGDRVMLRMPPTGIEIEPFGAGSGLFDAYAYQLFTCTETPPTPHDGIRYDKLVLTSISDITSVLLTQLEFVAESDVVGGPLLQNSLLFHAVDGEEYGIDAAIVFTAQEPGEAPFIFAYRTLSRVRDCSMRGIVRINHDVVKESMQGRSFINQANLMTAQVIRTHFADSTSMVLEPDREIGYHRNYMTHGFLWKLQQALKCSDTPPTSVSRESLTKYRRQVELDRERYPSIWIELPQPAEPGDGSGSRSEVTDPRKRRKVAAVSMIP